jgi:uncharacterized protein DUF1488
MFFRFPPDARWNPERSIVEFGIGVGEYEGVVRVSRRVFQILLPEDRTPSAPSRWAMFFRFPPDARWNPERSVVEFGIGVGEYEGVVRVSRRVFQILIPETLTPERCLEAYHLHRTRFELIAERKVRRRQLTDDGDVEITGRDLREREVRARRPIGYRRAAS